MQLTLHTDLGLRLLIVLARSPGRTVALPEFARVQRVSYHHAVKVARALARASFIAGRRGRGGGVLLTKPADALTVGQVVRALEPGFRMADCPNCQLAADCNARSALDDAVLAFLRVLDKVSLAQAAAQAR